MSRCIVIGDIHGCCDELLELLDTISPNRDDQIIALGDLVDRGPATEQVLEFFRDRPLARSIMGNHERKHLRSARGLTRAALSQLITKRELGGRYDEWLAFIESFARHIELPEAILVHGMLEPSVPLTAQQDTVVIGTLTGEAYLRERYDRPWYELYNGEKPVIVGHHDYRQDGQPLVREGAVYGIDTGAVRGRRLTAMILPDFRIVSVPSRHDYWRETRRRFALVSGSTRDNLDLTWAQLSAFAASDGPDTLTQQERERQVACRRLAAECDHLVSQILQSILARCQELVDKLRRTEQWQSYSPQKQGSHFAELLKDDPNAPLLHLARKDLLRGDNIRRRAPTPRQLFDLARSLDFDSADPQ